MARNAVRSVLIGLVITGIACGVDQGETSTTTATSTSATTGPTTTSTTTTTTIPATPAEIEEVALLPDEGSLHDGVWAAILFRQPLGCLPDDIDLVTAEPVECETPVLFEGETPDELIGEDVPVWLIRWPVMSYALGNGITTLDETRGLPTVIETVSEDYHETETEIRVTGTISGMGGYEIEVVGKEPRLQTPFSVGEEISLSGLTGDWETGRHLLRVEEGGSYELFEVIDAESVEETGVFGFIALQDGLLIFTTSANPGPCPGETGVYYGEWVGTGIRSKAVDEPCQLRSEALEGRWSLRPPG